MIYTEQPDGFIPDIEVVGCLVLSSDKILLLHRHDHKPHGDKWGIPAGKRDDVDDNRNIAMLRELREETGLVLEEKDLSFYKTFFVEHPGLNFLYHYHLVNLDKIPDVVIAEKEHKAFSWVTIDEALKMPLVPDEDFCLKDYCIHTIN